MEKFSKKELEYLANDIDIIYPDNHKELWEEKEKYLRSIGATDEDIAEGDDLCPDQFWWHANDMMCRLAQELLDEREKKYDALMEPIEELERSIKELKQVIQFNFE